MGEQYYPGAENDFLQLNYLDLGTGAETFRFQCAICNERFTYKYQLQKHRKMHESQPDLPEIANEPSIKPETDLLHEMDYSKKPSFQAQGLPKQEDQPNASEIVVEPDINSDLSLVDMECSKMSSISDDQKPHIIEQPTQNSSLPNHIYYPDGFISPHPEAAPPTCSAQKSEQTDADRPYLCDVCNKTFKRKQILQIHYKSHEDIRDYNCEYCDKAFKAKPTLVNHMLMVHSEYRPFVCNVCGKDFKMKQSLKFHQASHSDEKQFECEVCKKTFKLRIHLLSHMKIHDDTRPFMCEECPKAFKFKQQLEKHQMVHSGTKPWLCDQCSKAFMFKQQLQVHRKIHLNIKEFTCDDCTKSFRTKQQLKVHQRQHSN